MGKFHSLVWVPVQFPPGKTIPIVVLDNGQILFEAWYFFRTWGVRNLSASWFEKAATYIGSFYDFFRAMSPGALLPGQTAEKLINDCISAFQHGTVQPDGTDPTGLRWLPWSPTKVSHAISVLRRFCRTTADLWTDGNPLSSSQFAQATLSAFAREQKLFHSKLFHLAEKDTGYRVGKILRQHRGAIVIRGGTIKAFPKNFLGPLLFQGCKRAREMTEFAHPVANKYNLSLMMAILLQVGGGIRKSELFHLYPEDIRANEVRLYDPTKGRISWRSRPYGELKTGTRANYLIDHFGLVPRTAISRGDAMHAGWKSMLLDYREPHYYAVVQWISPQFRSLFYFLHRIYMDHVMPTRLKHPYLFVSLSFGQFGRPWTIGAYNDAFSEALRRIGEEPNADRGLNSHGLRHRYGQTLVDMGMSPLVIQHALHHISIESQLVYTKPSADRVRRMLEVASQFKSDENFVIPENNGLFEYNWKSDPLKLFAPWNLGGAQ